MLIIETMKKLIALSAFIILGSMAFAQTPVKQNAATPAAPGTMQVTAPLAVEAAPEMDATAIKADAKKGCSDADKKACGSKEGKKSCCSGKAEANKAETK
jgi:hypothetical protein